MGFKAFLLLSILFLILLGTVPGGRASNYEIGVEKGDEFIWKSKVCDEDKMRDLFGRNWNKNQTALFENLEQGARMRWIIKETEDDKEIYNSKKQKNEEFLSITYKKWEWTDQEKWGDNDYEDYFDHYADPKDYPDDYIFTNFAPIWLPLPLDDYLKEIDLYEGYNIDSRSIAALTCEIERNDWKGNYPTEFVKIQAMYDNQGILTSYKLFLKDNRVVIDISLDNSIISHPILKDYFFPSITAIFYIGVIYLIYKKIIKS